MKQGPLKAFLGILMLLLGGVVLFYDGTFANLIKAPVLDFAYPQATVSLSAHQLLMTPVVGWFFAGMGSVLVGLWLHQKKLI